MAHLEHLYALRAGHTRRLKGLELQQATYGISADPSIPNEIKDIQRKLADIERQIIKEWSSLLKRYESGFKKFLGLLDQHNQYRASAFDCQKRLRDLIHSVSQDGDYDTIVAECEQLMQLINDLAIRTIGTNFDDFVASSTPPASVGSSDPKTDIGQHHPASSATTNIYGSVGTMHSGSGDIYISNTPESTADSLELQFAVLRRAVSRYAADRELLVKGQRKLDDLRDAIRLGDIDELSAVVAWLQKYVSLSSALKDFFGDPAVYTTVRRTIPGVAEEFVRRVGSSER